MSAFVCGANQVAAVAKAVVEYEGKGEDAKELAKELGRLNVQSVGYRYKSSDDETTQDFLGLNLTAYLKQCASEVDAVPEYSQARLLGLVSSFLYQSCESDETYLSPLYQRVNKLEGVLEAKGVKREGWSL